MSSGSPATDVEHIRILLSDSKELNVVPKIAVVGLGRFGMALARQLGAGGAQVIAIDRSSQLVNEVRDYVDVAVRLDSTDKAALESQDLHSVDVCVVSIGENFEASLLTTVLARQLGIPKIICRAQTQMHAEIFKQIGAHEVIQPEVQAGQQLGYQLANDHIDNFLKLAEGLSLVELRAPKAFLGKALKQLELRSRYHVNLVLIRHRTVIPATEDAPESVVESITIPKADDVIAANDLLIVVGTDAALAKLPQE